MPRLIDQLGFNDRRKITIFTMFVLAFMSFSFVQGTVVQQFMDLHLTAWPIIAMRNLFAALGIVVAVGFVKNWI